MTCDLSDPQERYEAATSGQDDLVRIKETLEEERESLRTDTRSLQNLREEHSRLKVCLPPSPPEWCDGSQDV